VPSTHDDQSTGNVTRLIGHPRWRADFKQLASQAIERARAKLGMDRGEFSLLLTGLLGWDVTEQAVTRWEEGNTPPADVLLAASSAEDAGLIAPPDSLLGRVPPAFAAADLAGYWVSTYKFSHAGRVHYHADVSRLAAESDRHVRAVNHPPEPRTQGRAQGFRNELEGQLFLRHLIGEWRNDSDTRYFGAFQLAVLPGETVMAGYYTGLATDIKVSNSVWKWARVAGVAPPDDDLPAVILREPRDLYEMVKKKNANDSPLTWGDIREDG